MKTYNEKVRFAKSLDKILKTIRTSTTDEHREVVSKMIDNFEMYHKDLELTERLKKLIIT